jgi:hypothetical protein
MYKPNNFRSHKEEEPKLMVSPRNPSMKSEI